jgi:23S rRNA (cytosine1962-C5)-methyltransferase
METITGQLILKRKRDKPVRNRHPWIFSGSIDHIDGEPQPGDLVATRTFGGEFLAIGYYNPHSQIRSRLLTWQDTVPDDAFWRQQLQRAIDGRTLLAAAEGTTAYRLVNAESDGLPGLIVDRYGDYLVVQCLTLGIDRRKMRLAALLAELVQPLGIVERSDVSVRRKEGLPQASGMLWGDAPPPGLTVQENGLTFAVDLLTGHKTGHYLDQRENRALVCARPLVAGKTVLNVFSYTGGFGVYAAVNGAQRVINVDSSADILHSAENNFTLNHVDPSQHDFIAADAFQLLRHYRDTAGDEPPFDMIILDPPKFAHSRRDVDKAARGYKDLNWLALRLLKPGGWLATFSCSGLVSADLFQKIVFGAAIDAGRTAQITRTLTQGPDHPTALTFPEGAYLKGLLCRVW